MLNTITAVRLDREVSVGRNKPVILSCEDAQGEPIEVVAKFAHRCERGCNALIAEAMAAMFGADLGLPIPEPFVVQLDPDLADELLTRLPGRYAGDPAVPAFGSKKLPPGYGAYLPGKPLPNHLQTTAAEIIAFDVLVQNNDRLLKNPNCLTNGQKLAIIDHELAFSLIIGWTPPWQPGGLNYLDGPLGHLFFSALKGFPLDLARLAGAVEAVADERLNEYRQAIPTSWIDNDHLDIEMAETLRVMRGNMAGIATRLQEILQ